MEHERTEICQQRKGVVASILRSSENEQIEVIAGAIIEALDGNALLGFAYRRPNHSLIVNSVRDTRDAVHLSGGEGSPVCVLVIPVSS